MTHLINKDTLVAEIKRRLKFVEKRLKKNNSYTEEGNIAWVRDKALYDTYNSLLHFLDTIEVKSADLEEEIKEVQRDYKTIEEYEGYPCTMYANDIDWIARHFFELSFNAKGE